MSLLRARRSAPIAAVLLLMLATLARAGDHDRWFTLEMSGTRAGSMHSTQVTADGRITSRVEITMGLGRADTAMKIAMEGEFVETPDGKPVSMKSVQQLGAQPISTEYAFGEKEVTVTVRQGEQVTTSTRPLPDGKWLTPAAATEYVRQRLAAGAQEIVVRTIDPMSGPDPSIVTRKGIKKVKVEALGKTLDAYECVVSTSAQPGVESTEVTDEEGVPVKSTASMGGLSLTILPATREAATAAKGAAGPELMASTFVKPSRAIAHARELSRGVYLLSLSKGEMPTLPATGAQRVESAGERGVRVTVDAAGRAPATDSKEPQYLASTPMLKSDDPAIRALVQEATKDAGPDKPARAEAIRRFVNEFIRSKDLDVGFAAASEVARTRQGDCTEHAVLLAAMLRADGIPARVASGLIYADEFAGKRGIFGYHMWAQAALDSGGATSWVDLDGTLSRPFDATHITLAVSALPEGETAAALASIVPLMGRLKIAVEEPK
jgi:transglutaminase-like putative cysteine protease